MITLISGTNRVHSLTEKFSRIYFDLLKEKYTNVRFFNLTQLPPSIIEMEVYDNIPNELNKIQVEIFEASSKFIFIIPEYHGSMPGILKLLLDVMDAKKAFQNKKAALVGISTGRAGNLRGMDHLGAILQHMGVTVMPYLLPVSRVQDEFTDLHSLTEPTLKVVNRHIDELLEF